MATDLVTWVSLLLKVSKDDRVTWETLLLFRGFVVLLKAGSAVLGAVLVNSKENVVVGLNISESIGRVILVEWVTEIVAGLVPTVLKIIFLVVWAFVVATAKGAAVTSLMDKWLVLVPEVAEEVPWVLWSVIAIVAGICEVIR